MQIMLENKALTVNSGPVGEYTIKKKKIDPLDNTQKLEQTDRTYEIKKNDSINGKRLSLIPLNEDESDSSLNGRSNQIQNVINGPKKVKPNQDKIDSKYIQPPAPDFKQSKHYIDIEVNQQPQQLKKPPVENMPIKRHPIPHEYEPSFLYSQRPVQKNLNQLNGDVFIQNKTKILPHIKLRDSSFANTFIPVLPSFLTELK